MRCSAERLNARARPRLAQLARKAGPVPLVGGPGAVGEQLAQQRDAARVDRLRPAQRRGQLVQFVAVGEGWGPAPPGS